MRLNLKTAPTVERRSGVYQVLCLPTGKVYIGSAVWTDKRWRDHRQDLRNQNHYNRYLQRAWNKYGKDAFVFSVLIYCSPEQLIEFEQKAIERLRAAEREYGYNLQPTAGSNLGMKMSEAQKAQISARMKGKPLHPAFITASRAANFGNKYRLGQSPSPETRKKLSLASRGRKPFLGMKHTDKAKAKMSIKRRGIPLSVAHSQKIAFALRGRIRSPEHIKNHAISVASFTVIEAQKIRALYKEGLTSVRAMAAQARVHRQTIYNVINGAKEVYRQ